MRDLSGKQKDKFVRKIGILYCSSRRHRIRNRSLLLVRSYNTYLYASKVNILFVLTSRR